MEKKKLHFHGEDVILDRKSTCDFCGEKKTVGITHYGTTNYNRLICEDCIKRIKKYHKDCFGEEI